MIQPTILILRTNLTAIHYICNTRWKRGCLFLSDYVRHEIINYPIGNLALKQFTSCFNILMCYEIIILNVMFFVVV